LNVVAGPFTDDLDAFSFGEIMGVTPVVDYDFSVDQAPVDGGVTVGLMNPGCGAFAPNVMTSAGAGEAQGDYFTTAGVPAGCNILSPMGCGPAGGAPCDEAALGLIAPNPGPPAMPPLDNVDAMAEWPGAPGPCTMATGATPTTCGAFSVTAGSPVLGAIPPDMFTGAIPDGGTILAQPGTPPNPPNLPGGCPPGALPCSAVASFLLGLAPGDDLDALCWFDLDLDAVPDLPFTMFPGGDGYVFSLTPGSPSVAGPFSAADLLTPSPIVAGAMAVVRNHVSLGLAAGDDVDALICHQLDADFDGLPDVFDTVDSDRDGYTDVAEAGTPLCGANTLNNDSLDDAFLNDGCPVVGVAEADCADTTTVGLPLDDDGDGANNDGCVSVGGMAEGMFNIGTSPFLPCSPGVGPDPGTGWPNDFVSGGIPLSTDRTNILDLTSFLAPMTKLNTRPDAAPPAGAIFDVRYDMVPGQTIGGAASPWIQINDLTALLAGPPGFPAMFGGFPGGLRPFSIATAICSGP
jgi:hypothetical protein